MQAFIDSIRSDPSGADRRWLGGLSMALRPHVVIACDAAFLPHRVMPPVFRNRFAYRAMRLFLAIGALKIAEPVPVGGRLQGMAFRCSGSPSQKARSACGAGIISSRTSDPPTGS